MYELFEDFSALNFALFLTGTERFPERKKIKHLTGTHWLVNQM